MAKKYNQIKKYNNINQVDNYKNYEIKIIIKKIT